ncbi:TFIIB-type zinc finger domain-containing protein [Aspergillus alliaceus]|uniref:TFIIB-type zinc finger domain-containing protein n=1 Tax=Petromyces alliaceus TaxID=209559 RepID=UPI0012A59EA8|nr:RNA polymerase I-specific transcription initiation factor Rrn7 [Aspergillus alliaceus]KAB8232215.1 RNA polymerase I-specific transcription initiation factor Rrn7 [Aspergillus alliaceus]
MDYTTRGVCGQEGCRETRYYLDNGLWFCRRGHQQEGRQVEEEPDDFGTQGKTYRVKKVVAEKGPKTYRGRQAYSLFLQVYQLILWKQCHALVQDRGFPAQFEHVVRDLWALRLETYSDKINNPSEGEEEPEFFSSQPSVGQEEPSIIKFGGKNLQWPRLVDSVGLCYLGALLMRLPVGIGDFHRMIMCGEIPYIRVTRSIPREMRDKLPQQFLSIIETTRLLKAEHLQKAVLQLSLLYRRKFGMQFPALNLPPILYRHIRRLALPIDVYSAVKRLQDLLGFSLEFPNSFAGRTRLLDLPEIQVITLIVISTKLLFPFDEIKRYPASAKEPTTQVIDWKLWAQEQRHYDSRETAGGRIGKGNEVLVNERDVFDMTPSQLDEYMDWYENSWLDNSRVANPLSDLFPTGPASVDPQTAAPLEENNEEAISSMLKRVTQQLQPRKVILEDNTDTPRPGSSYVRYKMESDLPETARSFYETAAKVAGISLSTLVRAVSQAEYKITRWLEDQRRIELYGDAAGMEFAKFDSSDDMGEDMTDSEDSS